MMHTSKFKQLVNTLDWDGVLFLILGLSGVLFGITDFWGWWALDEKQTFQILIGAMGSLMLAVVSLMHKRRNDIEAIQNVIGVSDSKLIDSVDYQSHLIYSLSISKESFNEMFMNWAVERPGGTYLGFGWIEFQKAIYKKLEKNENFFFRQVYVVYHKQGLEELIHRILLFKEKNYYVRYYAPSPKSIPMIHILSFDSKDFFVGVGYPYGEPIKNKILNIQELNLKQLFATYWEVLWNCGMELNEAGTIKWDHIEEIAKNLGMGDSEYNAMKIKVEKQVIIDKKLIER